MKITIEGDDITERDVMALRKILCEYFKTDFKAEVGLKKSVIAKFTDN